LPGEIDTLTISSVTTLPNSVHRIARISKISANFFGLPGIPLDILGFPVDFLGFPGIPLDILGFPVDFQRFSSDFQRIFLDFQ